MTKQLAIIGIVAILITVGLSGCNMNFGEEQEKNSLPDFRVSGLIITDNCLRLSPQKGTACVNFTVTNIGCKGSARLYACVYQGMEDRQNCGNGHIYNVTRNSFLTLEQGESKDFSFFYPDVNCTNGVSCFGFKYWFDII